MQHQDQEETDHDTVNVVKLGLDQGERSKETKGLAEGVREAGLKGSVGTTCAPSLWGRCTRRGDQNNKKTQKTDLLANAEQLELGPCRIRQGAEDVEHRGDPDLLPDGTHVFHRRVELWPTRSRGCRFINSRETKYLPQKEAA